MCIYIHILVYKTHIFFLNICLVENQSRRNDSPDLNELMNDPMQAINKGWSFLSYGMEELGKVAASGARVAAQQAGQLSRYANEQLNDPNLRNNVSDYVNTFSKKVANLFFCSLCVCVCVCYIYL